MEKRLKRFYNDLYFQIYTFDVSTEEQYEKTFKKLEPGFTLNLSSADGNTTLGDDGTIHMWLRHKGVQGLSALCHECIHAATYTLRTRDIRISVDDDEALTYLAQWVFKRCLSQMGVKDEQAKKAK